MKDKIYIIIPYYLPGENGGGPVFSIKNILFYLEEKYDFYVITQNVDLKDSTPYPVPINTWTQQSNHHIYYMEPKDYHAKNILKIIDDKKDNILFLNSYFSKTTIQLMLFRKLKRIKNLHVILAPRGEFSKGALHQKKMKKFIFLQVAKLISLYKNVVWKASSPFEQEDIHQLYPDSLCKIATDLVNHENYFNSTKKKEKGVLKMIFLSRISPMKNLLFILKILESYQAQIPGKIIFDIYGPLEDRKYFDSCKKISDRLNQEDQITVNYRGKVSNQEVKKVIHPYHLFVLPTKGENFGHVIIESLMSNTPILISDRTKWNALEDYHIGYNIPLNEQDTYYEKIIEFLKADQQEYDRYLLKIPQYIKDKFQLERHIKEHIDLFKV